MDQSPHSSEKNSTSPSPTPPYTLNDAKNSADSTTKSKIFNYNLPIFTDQTALTMFELYVALFELSRFKSYINEK